MRWTLSINAVVMQLGDGEGFCIQCCLMKSSVLYQIWHILKTGFS